MRRAGLVALVLGIAGCMPRPQPIVDEPEPVPAPGVRLSIEAQHTTRKSATFTILVVNGDDAPLQLGPETFRLFDDRGRELRRLDPDTFLIPALGRARIEAEFDAPLAEGRQYQLRFQDTDTIPVTIAARPHKPWFMCFPEFVLDVTRGLCSEIICGGH